MLLRGAGEGASVSKLVVLQVKDLSLIPDQASSGQMQWHELVNLELERWRQAEAWLWLAMPAYPTRHVPGQ